MIASVVTSLLCLWYCTQLVVYHIFRTFLSFYSVGKNGSDILEFWEEALHGILAKLPGILLLCVPIPIVVLVIKRFQLLNQKKISYAVTSFVTATFVHIIFLLCLLVPGKGAHTPYDLYHVDYIQELSMQKLGVLIATNGDLKQVFWGNGELELLQEVFVPIV